MVTPAATPLRRPVREQRLDPRPLGISQRHTRTYDRLIQTKRPNCLDSIPKSAQSVGKKAIQDIYNAEDREHAAAAVKAFAKQYGAKFPKAVKKIVDDGRAVNACHLVALVRAGAHFEHGYLVERPQTTAA